MLDTACTAHTYNVPDVAPCPAIAVCACCGHTTALAWQEEMVSLLPGFRLVPDFAGAPLACGRCGAAQSR